jgi:hypothetical protein
MISNIIKLYHQLLIIGSIVTVRSIGKAICQKIATPGKGITATDEAPTLVGHGKSWQVSRDKCASIIEGLRESFPWGFADN